MFVTCERDSFETEEGCTACPTTVAGCESYSIPAQEEYFQSCKKCNFSSSDEASSQVNIWVIIVSLAISIFLILAFLFRLRKWYKGQAGNERTPGECKESNNEETIAFDASGNPTENVDPSDSTIPSGPTYTDQQLITEAEIAEDLNKEHNKDWNATVVE